MKGVIGGVIKEVFQKQRPEELKDESIGSFMTRRFGPNLPRNMLSAVLHGIYAGDIDRLSVKTLFPKIWHYEAVHGSVMRGALSRKKLEVYEDVQLRSELYPENLEVMKKLKSASVYSFKDGIETLSRALVADLASNLNVTIKAPADILGINYSPTDGFEIDKQQYSHVISTLYARSTNFLLPEASRIPALAAVDTVTVLVVNLYFANPKLLPLDGFGYLLPKSLPESANPHKALGVIFDSCATPQPSETGTKLTVMLGGHYWNGRTSFPSETEAVEMARERKPDRQ